MNHTEQFLANLQQKEVPQDPTVPQDPEVPNVPEVPQDPEPNNSEFRIPNSELKQRTVIDTTAGAKDGQNKCKTCGATDIAYDIEKATLVCRYCRAAEQPEPFDLVNAPIDTLEGTHLGSGADDINAEAEAIVTLKCQSCGAEVVIDTAEAMQSRCHWCRQTLSLNEQVPNGAVPDMVLPFAITRDEGKACLEKFVGSRKFFAHPRFKKEFSSENIFGVYLPYMIVDMKAHAQMEGEGEIKTAEYTETTGSGDNKQKTTYYDADVYRVSRQFDLLINDLSIEGSEDKLDKSGKSETKNVINAVMPFDVGNSVRWNANYLKGFRSEKRDVDIQRLRPLIDIQARDIARHKANDFITEYDRGVRWESDSIDIHGERWLSAYFPIWLYSYQQKKGLLHYTAVNARTRETMGSIPINYWLLVLVSVVITVASFFGIDLWAASDPEMDGNQWLSTLPGIGYFAYIYFRYRNTGERHYHEKETEAETQNETGSDTYIKERTRMRNAKIDGQNNNSNH